MRGFAYLAAALTVSTFITSCNGKKNTKIEVPSVPVSRRDIVVTAQATGTVEPVDTVAVKSQASGLIMVMPVEIGSQVKSGDLIAQIDTRTLRNDYDRAVAAARAAQSALDVASAALKRASTLYDQKVITADEHETAVVAEANARSQLISTQTTLKTARQNLEYATIRAEVSGTVISKNASIGTVVASAISNVGGGSTIVTIADLKRVRMRALVNETDVGNVHAGMPVTVTVDAFPNRQFSGVVEKVEPQATVQSSVTMFPVLVSLDNVDQALLPGMNGEVTIVTQQRQNVLAIPNDAIRTMKDAGVAATALGLPPDSVMPMASANRGGARRSRDSNASPSSPTSNAGRGNPIGGNTASPREATRSTRNGNQQLVFVKQGTTWSPHFIRTGASDFDFSEVLNGVNEGDQVALLNVAVLQAQRDQNQARIRTMTGSGLPGSGGAPGRQAGGARGGRPPQ